MSWMKEYDQLLTNLKAEIARSSYRGKAAGSLTICAVIGLVVAYWVISRSTPVLTDINTLPRPITVQAFTAMLLHIDSLSPCKSCSVSCS